MDAAMHYIATQAAKLEQAVLGKGLPVDTVCFFAQSAAEYDFLLAAVKKHGPISKFTHGATTYVDCDLTIDGHHITILGVRQPDPARPWIGYGDYPAAHYKRLLIDQSSNPFAHEITSGRGQSLLELRHPDFDVLGYVAAAEEHH